MYFFTFASALAFVQADVDSLLTSKWNQREAGAKYTPNSNRLGCQSTALAQAMYYYQLCPAGKVSYQAPGYPTSSMDFDQEKADYGLCNWSEFATLDNDATARYQYANALIVEKTWGTDGYMLSHFGRLDSIQKHYQGVSAEEWTMGSDYTRDDLANQIITELDNKKPLLLHLANGDHSVKHWVVIDGYKSTGSMGLTVHINYGHGGSSDDAWYDFDMAIGEYNDVFYKQLVTIDAGVEPPGPPPSGDTWYKTITPSSNTGLCLDLPGGDTTQGTGLWLWECNGAESQHWVFEGYQIRYGADESKCVDAGDMSNGQQAFLWDCNGFPQQDWSYGEDASRIYLSNTGTCMDFFEDQQWNGQPVHTWECNGHWNQEWGLWNVYSNGVNTATSVSEIFIV